MKEGAALLKIAVCDDEQLYLDKTREMLAQYAAAKPDLSADAPDLVAVIANVLENALHGAAKSGHESPFIHVNIKHQAGHFVVSCDNSCVKSLNFDEMPDYMKGIGIQSITATAENTVLSKMNWYVEMIPVYHTEYLLIQALNRNIRRISEFLFTILPPIRTE